MNMKQLELSNNGARYAKPRVLNIILGMEISVLPLMALEGLMLNDFAPGANRMGNTLLNDS